MHEGRTIQSYGVGLLKLRGLAVIKRIISLLMFGLLLYCLYFYIAYLSRDRSECENSSMKFYNYSGKKHEPYWCKNIWEMLIDDLSAR